MDSLALFEKRTCVRRFTDKPVTREELNTLIRAAVAAPSAGNRQPWHFVALLNRGRILALQGVVYRQPWIDTAPCLIAVCADAARSAERYGGRGETLYCLQDTAAAVQNILLCAVSMGLGGCWVGAFDEEACARALELPAGLRPVALVPVGTPAEEGHKPRRRPLSEVLTVVE